MKIKNKILYGIAYSFWFVLSLLPFRILFILSDCLYFIVAKVVKYRHKVIRKNLIESFPDKTDKELSDIEKGFYHWFCDYLVETIKLMITSIPYWIPNNVQCCELYHPLENETIDKLFKEVREKQNALCIPMQESLRKIISFKRNSKSIVVGYIADQTPLWWNIHHWVDFLHHDTPVLTGSERIIRHTNQVSFYGYMRRPKRGYYECEMKLMTDCLTKTSEFEITDIYFRMLEENIKNAPSYYLWSHNRWKRTREEFNEKWEVVDGKVLRKKHTN